MFGNIKALEGWAKEFPLFNSGLKNPESELVDTAEIQKGLTKVVHNLILIMFIPIIGIITYNFFVAGFLPIHFILYAMFGWLAYAAFSGDKIHYKRKMWVTLGIVTLSTSTTFFYGGIAGTSLNNGLVLLLISALIVGIKGATSILLYLLITLIISYFAYKYGYSWNSVPLGTLTQEPRIWVLKILSLISDFVLIIYCSGWLRSAIITSLDKQVGMRNLLSEKRDKLGELNELAQNADRAKGEFLKIAGQELKKPVPTLIKSIENLKHPEKTESSAKTCQSQSLHLLGLIDYILDYINIGDGRATLNNKRTQLSAINEQLSANLFELEQRGLTQPGTIEFQGLHESTDDRDIMIDSKRFADFAILACIHNINAYSGSKLHLSLEKTDINYEECTLTLRIRKEPHQDAQSSDSDSPDGIYQAMYKRVAEMLSVCG